MGYNSMSEEEIRAAVMDAARQSFLSVGIAGTQMNRIAQEVGVSRSTLYLYFPSKVELVFHVSREMMRSIVRGAEEHVAAAGCADGFSAMHEHLRYLLMHYSENTNVARFFDEFDAIYSGDYPDVEETRLYAADMAGYMRNFYAIITRGQADGSIRDDLPANTLGSILDDGLFGIIQRLFPRKAHIEQEHAVEIEKVADLFLSFLENSVKKSM